MNREELEQIAQRSTCCKPFGEAVTISRIERDELVALARHGMRYQWLRTSLFQQWFAVGEAEIGMRAYGACPAEADIDAAIDAEMAKEGA